MKELPKWNPIKIVSTVDIANVTGKTPRTVQRWCVSGDLKSERLGNEYAILWQDFLAFWKERNK